jgi:hypothetical protein
MNVQNREMNFETIRGAASAGAARREQRRQEGGIMTGELEDALKRERMPWKLDEIRRTRNRVESVKAGNAARVGFKDRSRRSSASVTAAERKSEAEEALDTLVGTQASTAQPDSGSRNWNKTVAEL